MAIDRVDNGSDTDAEKTGKPPPERRRPPPDQPDVEGFPSRADSRRAATAANNAERRQPAAYVTVDRSDSTRPSEKTAHAADDREAGGQENQRDDSRAATAVGDEAEEVSAGSRDDNPADRSIGDREGSESEIPKYSTEQLARLREAENAIRGITEKHGVSVDYTRHPIDHANALEFNKAIARMAHEYPGAFRHVRNIKVLDANGMAEGGSDAKITLGHTIHEGQRPVGGDPIEPGIYLSQPNFADKSITDDRAADARARGWNMSGTAEGTLYHEFGHVIENQLRKNPALRNELARELKSINLSVDPDSLAVAHPPGPRAVINGLSRYAAKNNTKEMIAEGFSEWKLGEHPRPIARAIGTVIDRNFKGK